MTMAEALAILNERVTPVTDVMDTALMAACGRTLAEDIVAEVDVPPHDNAAVDGYGVRFDELSDDGETTLRVVGRAAAGHPYDGALKAGEAVRIFTGAVLPRGVDTVVMQEDVDVDEDRVVIPLGLKRGANRRRRGEDVSAGRAILRRGRRLRPQDVGLAAAVGLRRLRVYRPLSVGVFSTGDEVCEPGGPLPVGAVYDSNRYLLAGLLGLLGCSVDDLGILPDRAETVRDALAGAAVDHDLLITSGGVSTGEEDHVRAAVEALGRLHFWRLAIKPGRPLALGQVGTVPFVGLPGNPVAAMVCFLRFARPLILRLGGADDTAPVLYRVRADFDLTKKPDRREWVRARLVRAEDGTLSARKFEQQGSGILSSMVESDGLVEIGEAITHLRQGSLVDFLPFSEVGS